MVERFYRGDASRGTPGIGLGLSLVAAVASLHGGTLEFSDNRPGFRAALLLSPITREVTQPTYLGAALRHAAGGMPNSRLNARLKAASDS